MDLYEDRFGKTVQKTGTLYKRPIWPSFLLSRLTNAILMPWWLYLEINWKDIWKPIRVDILNWCDTYYLHVDIHPLCI